jgi:hypothetical protein
MHTRSTIAIADPCGRRRGMDSAASALRVSARGNLLIVEDEAGSAFALKIILESYYEIRSDEEKVANIIDTLALNALAFTAQG